MNYRLKEKSANRKVGKIPVVCASADTCWGGCPLHDMCYASSGPGAIHWRKVTNGERGTSIAELANNLLSVLAVEMPWRYADAGDLPGLGPIVDAAGVYAIAEANRLTGARGWTYTHKPVDPVSLLALGTIVGADTMRANRAVIKSANDWGWTINISTEGWTRPDLALALNIGPVVTVLPSTMGDWKTARTTAGVPIVRCPAEASDSLQCIRCGGTKGPLCWRRDRKQVVGFTSHGSRRRKVDAIIEAIERRMNDVRGAGRRAAG